VYSDILYIKLISISKTFLSSLDDSTVRVKQTFNMQKYFEVVNSFTLITYIKLLNEVNQLSL
jgi:hypothetical protein